MKKRETKRRYQKLGWSFEIDREDLVDTMERTHKRHNEQQAESTREQERKRESYTVVQNNPRGEENQTTSVKLMFWEATRKGMLAGYR
jgi:hypothetical protein